MDRDFFRFLRPWTDLLPPAEGALVAIAGSGGCTTTLLRLLSVYRERGARVLVTQTTPHPVPFAVADHAYPADADVVRKAIAADGLACVGGTGDGDGLAPEAVADFARSVGAHVTLVQAQAPCGTPLRGDAAAAPRWPVRTSLALVVGSLGAVGRPWGPRTVEDAAEVETDDAGDPRRVTTDDVVTGVRSGLATVPDDARPLPFLTGFGSYRDLDGMFALAQELVTPPRVPVVCLAELLGDERRDAADRRAAPEESVWYDDERVYAIYPAAMDERDESA